jgi:DNA-binding GntR family transcriptional regulator
MYDISSVEEYRSKSDVVTAAVREAVITGELKGGTPLRQRDLAERFGVSPTPVREALRRLESEGLVRYDLHRGATVIDGAFGATEENYQVRAALESLAARLAATRMSEAELEELEAIHSELARCRDRSRQALELNRRFHFHIYEASRSPVLLALLRLLWRSFPLEPQLRRPLPESVRMHGEILAALRARDPDAAERLTREHILGAMALVATEAKPRARSRAAKNQHEPLAGIGGRSHGSRP